MARIEWVKLKPDMFNDDKIKLIQALPSGDSIIVIWIRMLILAGVSNSDGYLYVSENLPYTEEMLSVVFNKPLPLIRLALNTFKEYGMLEENANGFCIANIETQSDECKGTSPNIREYNRLRKAAYREKIRQQKLEVSNTTDSDKMLTGECYGSMSHDCPGQNWDNVPDKTGTEMGQNWDNVPDNHGTKLGQYPRNVPEMSRNCPENGKNEQDLGDIDNIYINNNNIYKNNINNNINNNISPKSKDFGKEYLDYKKIMDFYNLTCRDLPRVRGLSDERKRKIKTLLGSLKKAKILPDLDDYEKLQHIFALADESDFLSGRDAPNSWCGFDWLIQPKNAIKVIEGNYKNRGAVRHGGDEQADAPQSVGTYTRESECDALEAFRAGKPPLSDV